MPFTIRLMVPQAKSISTYGTISTSPAVSVPAVERALDVLELLENSDRRLTLSEIARELDLPKGSAHRLLTTLRDRGYLAQRSDGAAYGLGARFVALSARAQVQWDVSRAAAEPMRRLAQATGEGCQLSVRSGGQALCVSRVASPTHPEVALMGGIGSSFPLHAVAVGKALLAWASDAERDAYLRTPQLSSFTPQTITDPAALAEELESIRQDGLARDREEYKRGLWALAAPVFDASSDPLSPVAVAAIALPLLVGGTPETGDAADSSLFAIEDTLRAVASATSRALGYRGDDL